MKLSNWFPPEVKPVRKGVYERLLPAGFGPYSYWNGQFWGGWGRWLETAEANKDDESSIQNAKWRGLARKPK